MRISSLRDIQCMGENARKQIANALKEAPISNVKRASSEDDFRNKSPTVVEKKKGKRKKLSRVLKDPVTGLNYCQWPSPDPGVWLHELLNKHFGSFSSGGDHAHEVIIDGFKTKVRYDHLLFGVLFIEFDGFAFHKHLDNFKLDRKKQRHALINGFLLHRLTREDVVEHFDEIIPDIHAMLKHVTKYNMEIKPVGKTQCKLVGRTPKYCG